MKNDLDQSAEGKSTPVQSAATANRRAWSTPELVQLSLDKTANGATQKFEAGQGHCLVCS